MGFVDDLKKKFNKLVGVSEEDIKSSGKGFVAPAEFDDSKDKSGVKTVQYKSKEEYLNSKKSGKILQSTFRSTLITLTGTTIAFTLATVIDGVLIGQFLDSNAIAASGLATPFFFLMTAISEVFSTGTQARCANYMGHGDMKRANSTFNASLLLCIIAGAIILVAGVVFQDPIASVLGANKSTPQMEDVFNGATGYICGLALGCPVYLLFNIIQPFMQLDGDRKRVIPSTVICAVVNIAGDLINVFFLGWGMFGMAIATSFSFLAGLLYLLPHFWSKKAHYSINPKLLSFKGYLSVINTGLPKAASKVLFIIRSIIINGILLGLAGSVGVAALSIQGNSYSVFGCVIIAQGFTTILLTNIYFGEHDKTGLRQLLRSNFIVSLFVVGAIMVLLIVLAPFVAMIYTNDPEVIECATTAIRLIALSMPFYSLNLVLENFAQGTGRLKLTYVILVVDHFALIILFALVLPSFLAINGVWLAFVLCEPIMLIIYIVYVMKKKHKAKINIEDFMLLADDFDVPDSQKFEYSITDTEDVMMASLGAEVCCMRNGIDAKRTNIVSLCIEEMAKNIVDHGIKDQTKQRIDVKVIIDNYHAGAQDDNADSNDSKTKANKTKITKDKKTKDIKPDVKSGKSKDKPAQTIQAIITIRLRDNCLAFNPVDHHKEMDLDNPMAGIGIRMVFKAAKDVNYISTMNLNNLVIKI